ncbi:MAG: Fur family transcriptional regulator [Ilumatobacter sp.]|nr:Fur family transcriptional regulator [Ilumatobacter sp.]
MRSPSALIDALRDRGLKVTPQRQLLFRLLDGNRCHPTAESLHAAASREMPGISLRTVYMTLADLTDMREIEVLSVDGGAARFDSNTDDHHHVLCCECGNVEDVYVGGVSDLEVVGLDGFTPSTTSIVFHGICRECAASST